MKTRRWALAGLGAAALAIGVATAVLWHEGRTRAAPPAPAATGPSDRAVER